MMEKVIWMEVTNDEYDLPLAFANCATQLADMVGVKRNAVFEAVSKWKAGKTKTCRYRRVVLEEDGSE